MVYILAVVHAFLWGIHSAIVGSVVSKHNQKSYPFIIKFNCCDSEHPYSDSSTVHDVHYSHGWRVSFFLDMLLTVMVSVRLIV